MSNLSVSCCLLGIDAINKANSGHPGVVMGAAPMKHGLTNDFVSISTTKLDQPRPLYSVNGYGFVFFMLTTSPFWF